MCLLKFHAQDRIRAIFDTMVTDFSARSIFGIQVQVYAGLWKVNFESALVSEAVEYDEVCHQQA